MAATLYVIPGSHPSRTARLMLARKGIDYRRRDLIPVVSKGVLRLAGFPRVTVPALRIDGERVQGSKEIARALERIRPEPPLFPAAQEARAEVETVEAFGDSELQGVARRILWGALGRDKEPLRSYSAGARLGVPVGVAVKTAAPIVALSARFNQATDENVRADIAALPGMLERVDEWIAAGVLGGEEPNAADYQVATSIRLLMTLDDLRPAIAARPAGELAMAIDPDYPGEVPRILPPQWLEPLAKAAA